MDTVTHGITGALVGKAFFAERHGRAATLAVTLGAVFPDSDVFLELFAQNELAIVEWHRGVTHSFVALPVFAALLAGVTRYALRRTASGPGTTGFATLWTLYALGLASHILLDLITSFGTMIWSPTSSTRAAWDLVFIIDFIFTGIVLLPQVAAWIYAEPPKGSAAAWRRGLLAWAFFSAFAGATAAVVAPILEVPFPTRLVLVVSELIGFILLLPAAPAGWGFRASRTVFCRIGVAALAGYLALCTASHYFAVKHVEEFARRQRIAVKSLAALPAPLSPFRWSGLILTPAGIYQSEFGVLEARLPAFDFVPSAAPNRYIEIAERLPSVKTFRWFARFPVVSYRDAGDTHIVEYTDLRFRPQLGRLRRRRGFTLQVLLNGRGEVLRAGLLRS